MRKNRPVVIILILSLILSFLSHSEVSAVSIVETEAKTEQVEEVTETDNSSGNDGTQNLEEPNETEAVIQKSSDISESDKQDSMTETENDISEEYQEGSSVQNATAGNYTYSQSNGKITITKYSGMEEVVEIPAEIDGALVTGIGTRAFQNCTTIKAFHRTSFPNEGDNDLFRKKL